MRCGAVTVNGVGIEDQHKAQQPSRPGADFTEGKSLAQNLTGPGPDSFNHVEVTQGSQTGPGLEWWQNEVIQLAFSEGTRQLLPDSVFALSWENNKKVTTMSAFAQWTE